MSLIMNVTVLLYLFLNFSMIKLHLCEFTFGGYRVRNAVQKQLICVIAVMLMASVFLSLHKHQLLLKQMILALKQTQPF